MYANIADSKKSIQTATISGTIGNVSFDGGNVIRGSFNVTNQCCDTSTFNYGGVYIGELTASFMGLNIPRNSWVGLEITPTVTIGDDDIPLGVYIVNEAQHSGNKASVKAYDRMSRFDIAPSMTEGSNGTPYDILALACQECNVPLGMTQAEVELLPNGNLPLTIGMIGDIETWRDILYWVAVTTASFCTMNRDGELELKAYHTTADDSIPANIRFNGSQYGDEIVKYTGFTIGVAEDETVEYYANDPDDEYSLDLGTNPFFQTTKAARQVFANNILTVLSDIEYVPCGVEIPFGFHYDLGDVLNFPNGNGSATNKFCVMYYSWNLNGKCQIKSIPTPTKAMSKTDKDLQTAVSSAKKDEVAAYEAKNTAAISIGDGETKELIRVRMAATKATKAEIHVEVDLTTQANTPTLDFEVEDNIIHLEDIWQGVNDSAVIGEVTYLINNEEDDLHPTESWIDGDHVLHLMYILPLPAASITTFEAFMKSTGGTITIPRGNVWLYAQGVGLVGDDKFGGILDVTDEPAAWNIVEVGFGGASDSVSINAQSPVGITGTDTASAWNVVEISFASATDNVPTIQLHLYSFDRITEDGEYRLTEVGEARITEGD